MKFPKQTDSQTISRLTPPEGTEPVHAVLDTDTYNEVDDQFALAYAMLSPERIKLDAIYAAPFHNARSRSPEDGMEKSYGEILRVLKKMDIEKSDGFVFKGAPTYVEDSDWAVDSPAAQNLIERARSAEDLPLYVLAVGAITNIASAIMLEPAIIEKITVVWLGGQPHGWHTAREFNLKQDPAASRLIFDCGVPLVHIPCTNVAEHLRTTVPELTHCLKGKSPLADYLCEIVEAFHEEHFAWSKVIWDIATVAYLVNPDWVPTAITHSPRLTSNLTYSADDRCGLIRVAQHANRDAIFRDMFTKITDCTSPG